MLKFDLGNGYYIRRMDEWNWIVARNTGSKEKIKCYAYDLQTAWYHAIRLSLTKAESKTELRKIVQDLNALELKFDSYTPDHEVLNEKPSVVSSSEEEGL